MTDLTCSKQSSETSRHRPFQSFDNHPITEAITLVIRTPLNLKVTRLGKRKVRSNWKGGVNNVPSDCQEGWERSTMLRWYLSRKWRLKAALKEHRGRAHWFLFVCWFVHKLSKPAVQTQSSENVLNYSSQQNKSKSFRCWPPLAVNIISWLLLSWEHGTAHNIHS